jgi:hypothetical protein
MFLAGCPLGTSIGLPLGDEIPDMHEHTLPVFKTAGKVVALS